MNSIAENLNKIKASLPDNVTLVAVSKTKSIEEIIEAYKAGQRVFGENKIQEMTEKQEQLPEDIAWHMIGHVQRNKVKYMAPYVSLIHGVDSLKLLKEIDKQAQKNNRIVNCLLQVYIAKEDTKFGLDADEIVTILNSEAFKNLKNIRVAGLMGMATFTENKKQIASEFAYLKSVFDSLRSSSEAANLKLETLSMGMSGDYPLAIENGSNMVRVGSAIFGERNYN